MSHSDSIRLAQHHSLLASPRHVSSPIDRYVCVCVCEYCNIDSSLAVQKLNYYALSIASNNNNAACEGHFAFYVNNVIKIKQTTNLLYTQTHTHIYIRVGGTMRRYHNCCFYQQHIIFTFFSQAFLLLVSFISIIVFQFLMN